MLFSPGTVIANDLPPPEAATPKTETPATPQPDAPKPDATPGTGTKDTPAAPLDAKALLEVINADREQREKALRDAQERETYKKQYEEAKAKLDSIEKAKKNRLLDPAGFLRKMGYTDRDLALTSEGIMYSLMPDKAPPAWIHNLVNAQREMDQQEREEQDKARELEAQKKADEAKSTEAKTIEANYRASLEREVAALQPGTFKASQAWFADDHKGYAQELFATAQTVAEAAMKAGKYVDNISLAAAQEVENKYEERAKRLVAVYSAATPPATKATQPQQKPTPAPSQQEETNTTTVIAKATRQVPTDKELIERAAKAAFGGR